MKKLLKKPNLNYSRRTYLAILVTVIFFSLAATIWAAISSNIGNSSTTAATQASTEKHMVRTSEGTMHSFVQVGTQTSTCGGVAKSGLLWFDSTDNGATWVCQSQLSSDTTNLMYASATVDSSDNVYVVYSVAVNGASASNDVFYQKLTKGSGATWTVGAAQTVLDASASTGYSYAVMEVEGTTRLWLAARYFDGSNYQVTVYDSNNLNDAPTWTVSQASLDTAGNGTTTHFPAMVRFGSNIGILYNAQLPTAVMRWRIRNDSDGLTSWSAENVVSANLPTTPTFSAISDSAGNVYFAQNNTTNVLFNYWNGSTWSATTVVSATAASNTFVSLSTDGTNVWIFYGDTNGLSPTLSGSRKLVYKKGILPYTATEFDTNPTNAVAYQDTFDKYWSFVSSAYTNDTVDAGDIDATNTVSSGAGNDVQMTTAIGDIAYFGKTAKFDAISWAMTTNGIGGVIAWEYWNGSSWTALSFTTSSAPNFTASGYGAFTAPADWATTAINGEGSSFFYIRARTTTAFTTTPVGFQMTSIPLINWSNFLPAPVSNTIYGQWTENASSPVKVRTGSISVTANTPNAASTANLTGVIGYSATNVATQPSNLRHMVKTSDGTIHAFIQSSTVSPCGASTSSNNGMGVNWIYSTDSGSTWACGGLLSNDTTNLMYASATVDSSDNIYVVYSSATAGANANFKIYYRKLKKGSGSTWTVGSQQTAVDATSSQGFNYATIEVEGTTRLWLAARYFDGTNYQVSVYYSNDQSAAPTWTVSQATLNTGSTASIDNIPEIVRFGSSIGVVYTASTVNITRWRYRNDGDSLTSWVQESNVSTENLDSAAFTVVSDGSNVYYASNQLTNIFFTYWNGTAWQPTNTISATAIADNLVSLSTDGTNVWIFYTDTTNLSATLTGSRKMVYKKGVAPFNVANFDATATAVNSYEDVFDKYWSFVSSAYTNDTVDAGDLDATNTASSGAGNDLQMVTGAGDIAYFSKTAKFDTVAWALTTAGVGGQIAWEYWNGSSWVSITKFLGLTAPSFSASGYISFIPPSDWATTSVNSEVTPYYYLRARTITAFTTTPVGFQVTSIPQTNWSSFLATPISNTVYGMWTENGTSPTRIKLKALSVTPETTGTSTTNLTNPGVVGYSSTTAATQVSTQHHLVRTSDGTLHAFIQASSRLACGGSSTNNNLGLNWVYSTDNGGTWNCGGQLSNDVSNLEYASATVDSSDNIYVVYSVIADGSNAAYSTFYRKLTKGSGSTWTLSGAQNALDSSSGTIAYTYSTIEAQGTTRLWLATRYFDGNNYQVATYYSSDMSATPTWTASQVPLDTASGSVSDHYPALVRFGSSIGVIYSAQFPAAQQRWRYRNDSDGLTTWSQEGVVSTENMANATFTAVGDTNGNVYYASNSTTNIFFSYWNGTVWSNPTTVSATAASVAFVGLSTDGYNVWVTYGDTNGVSASLPGSRKLVYKKGIPPYTATEFDAASTNTIASEDVFDKYWSFVSSAYTDNTTGASNVTASDTQMVTGVGDIAYFGKLAKFDTVAWALSTNGTSGIVTWEYWNGSAWVGLTDFQGFSAPSFTSAGYVTFIPPSDWATTKVNSESTAYYYLRARTTTAFGTPPVGLQMMSMPLISWGGVLAAPVSNTIYGLWNENGNAPVRVRSGSFTISATTPNTASAANLLPSVASATLYSSTTTATQPSTERHIVQTSDGTLHTFIQAGNSSPCGNSTSSTNVGNTPGLDWLYSTDSGQNWSCGGQLSNDIASLVYASATVDSADNIYVVYSMAVNGSNAAADVYYRKLTKGSGSTWTLGSSQTVLDASATQGYSYATIEAEGTNRLWLAVRYFDNVNYQVSVYYSNDLSDTPTWTASQTTLDTAGNAATSHYPALVRFGSNIGVIYNEQATSNMRWRYRADSDGVTSWNSEATVSSTNPVSPTFSAAGNTSSSNVYVAMNVGTNVIFTAWTGAAWSANATVSSLAASAAFVSVSTVGSNVEVYYGDTTGLSGTLSGSRKLVYKQGVSPYATANFDTNPTQAVSYHGTFDKYWSFVSSAYVNDTTDAADVDATNTGSSGAGNDMQMVTAAGDIAYFGKTAKFDTVAWALTTAGIGGQIVWEYWNGSSWVPINKFLGVSAPSFTASGYISFIPPSDWATTAVNSEGSSFYYLRARTITNFTTTPVGFQAASIPQINWASAVQNAANLYYIWAENANTPVRVRYSAYIYNVAPNVPSALGPSNLVDGSATNSSQPTLTFTTSDTNIGDTVQYRIQIDDSSDFASPVVDYTSALAATGATSFTVGQAAGSGSYTVGSSSQTLSDGSYYWRVQLTDLGGLSSSNTTANGGAVAFQVDTTHPTSNTTTITMLRGNGGTVVTSNGWTKQNTPYFSWDAGTDNVGGSGVKGYCLYLGTDIAGDPATSKGLLGTSPVSTTGSTCQFIISTTSIDLSTLAYQGGTWLTTSSSPYYLNIKIIDSVNNVYSGSSTQFQFRYDNVIPNNVAFINPASGNFSNVVDMSFAWPTTGASSATDTTAGVLGWQYQINSTSGTWLGTTTNTGLGVSYIPTTDNSYTLTSLQDGPSIVSGNNTIYFRTIDTAGNVSSDATIRTGVLQFGGAAPSFSGGSTVSVSPSTSTTNGFTLSWPAATATGGQNVTHYYYMINTTPPASLATLQGNSSAYIDNGTSLNVPATALTNVNKGTNTVYVVAIDDATTPNYSPSSYISGTFTLNSTSPDNVGNLIATDSSIKSISQWNVTLTWTAPAYQGAGNLTYLVYRSTDNSSFSQVGSSTGLSYVDGAPDSSLFYYKVYSKDGANSQSSGTNSVSITPTGKWTSAPDLDTGPTESNITTKNATIIWSTSRSADSKIAYGTSSGSYGAVEPSSSTQTTSHSIQLTGLTPGTTYYYVAKWTDEDGNTGSSSEKNFQTAPAPTVQDVSATNVGLDSAIINFTSVGASSVKIYYGTTVAFGAVKEISTSIASTAYTAQLIGLADGTKYYYKINTFDSDGSEYDGTALDFTTLPRPKISGVRIQQVSNTAQTELLISWTTNTEVSSIVTYYPEGNPGASRDEVNVALIKGPHQVIIRSLLPQSPYLLQVKGRDKAGNEASSDIQKLTTATDTRPPQISSLDVEGSNVPAVSSNGQESMAQLVVSWNTDEPATSQVEFGEGTGTTYSQKTQEDSNLTLNHLVIISGLTPSKVYHLRAISKDKATNLGNSIDTVMITPKVTANALDLVISNLQQAFGFLGGLK